MGHFPSSRSYHAALLMAPNSMSSPVVTPSIMLILMLYLSLLCVCARVDETRNDDVILGINRFPAFDSALVIRKTEKCKCVFVRYPLKSPGINEEVIRLAVYFWKPGSIQC